LLVVLWTVALLALIGSHIASSARGSVTRSTAFRAAAEAGTAADGLAKQAIFGLLARSSGRWRADGIERAVPLAGGSATIVVGDAAGRINPGAASPALMAALLGRVGADRTTAGRIGAAVAAWHVAASDPGAAIEPYRNAGIAWSPPGARFLSNDELLMVLGMTPDILARLAPYISVYTDGRVDMAKTSPLVAGVLQAAGEDRPPPPDEHAPLIADIVARVTLHGARAVRHAVVRIDPDEDEPNRIYRILAWD
jgi:general secretion pathway protein K